MAITWPWVSRRHLREREQGHATRERLSAERIQRLQGQLDSALDELYRIAHPLKRVSEHALAAPLRDGGYEFVCETPSGGSR